MKGSSRAWRILHAVILVAAVGFLGHRVLTNVEKIRGFAWHLEPLRLVASGAIHVGVFLWGTFVWSRILRCFDAPGVGMRTLLRIWSTSTLARYVPGSIWQFVVGARLAQRYEVSPVLLLTSLAVQMGITLAAAGVVAIVTAPFYLAGAPPWIGLGVPVAIVLVHPRAIDGARRLLARLVRQDLPRWSGSWSEGVRFLFLHLAGWVVSGAAFWLLLGSLAEMPVATLPKAAGIHAAVFVTGYTAFFVPAGLGVREAALALLLDGYFPDGVSVAIAAVTRLWTIGAELGTIGVSLAFAPRRPERPA